MRRTELVLRSEDLHRKIYNKKQHFFLSSILSFLSSFNKLDVSFLMRILCMIKFILIKNRLPKELENKPKPEQAPMGVGLSEHFQITWRVATITLLSIVVFGGGGWLLDKWIRTFPLFMIIGMVISYPVAQILIYIVFKRRHNL